MARTCAACRDSIGWNDSAKAIAGLLYHTRCVPLGAAKGKASDEPMVLLTTTPSLDGFEVTRYLDVVTAECVFGMNVFRDFFAGMTDFFGGRSESSQDVLRDARKVCLRELRREAAAIGANAVLGVDLDYSEFSGQGKSMLFLVASGTAVQVLRRLPEVTREVERVSASGNSA